MLLVLYLVSEGVLSPLIMPAMLPDMLDSAADTDNQKNKKVDKPGGKSAVCGVNYCVAQLRSVSI